jgi:hypothetical protein
VKVDPLAELEAKLFAAAREEQPEAELLERVLRAAREPARHPAALRSRSAPPASNRRVRASSSKLGWLLAAAALAAALGLAWLRSFERHGELAISAEHAPRQTQPAIAPSPSAPAVSAPVPAVAVPPRAPAAPAVKAEAPERTRPHPARATTAPQRASAPGSEPPAAPATLATEIGLLKQAREALREGDAARASSLLDGYDAAHGTALGAEATLLRIEVLSAQGHSEQARALAQRFLADNPDSPLADRARRLSAARGAASGVSP